jgi:hypothetical protein
MGTCLLEGRSVPDITEDKISRGADLFLKKEVFGTILLAEFVLFEYF